jgi:hypothetical protein
MFEDLREIIAQRIEEREAGNPFTLRELLHAEWPDNPGLARQLGRDFRKNLNAFPDVADVGRDAENHRLYRKN